MKNKIAQEVAKKLEIKTKEVKTKPKSNKEIEAEKKKREQEVLDMIDFESSSQDRKEKKEESKKNAVAQKVKASIKRSLTSRRE